MAAAACSRGSGSSAPETTTTAAPAPRYVPTAEWDTVSADDLGWDQQGLDDALAFAGERSTQALVLLVDGRILAERYYGVDSGFRRDIASCQKSVVSLLVGMAVEEGVVGLDDPVIEHLGAGWTNASAAEEELITIRHLLSMSSGLDASRRAVAEPGEVWSYNNDAYHQLQPVLEAATGTGIDALSSDWLWRPLGATASTWYERRGNGGEAIDAKGDRIWGLVMSARDMARFGLLAARDGVWGTDRLVEPSYLERALSSSTTGEPAATGICGGSTDRTAIASGPSGELQPGSLIPDAPADLVAALGKDDQKIYVSRSTELVLVRQGGRAGRRSAEALSDFDTELWQRVLFGPSRLIRCSSRRRSVSHLVGMRRVRRRDRSRRGRR